MDKELEELMVRRDAAQRAVSALTDAGIEADALAMRARLVELEHEERRSFGSLNGDSQAALAVTNEKLVVAARLRALGAARDARSVQRQEASRTLHAATRGIQKREAVLLQPVIQREQAEARKALEGVYAALERVKAAAAAMQGDTGVPPDLGGLQSWQAAADQLGRVLGLEIPSPMQLAYREATRPRQTVKA